MKLPADWRDLREQFRALLNNDAPSDPLEVTTPGATAPYGVSAGPHDRGRLRSQFLTLAKRGGGWLGASADEACDAWLARLCQRSLHAWKSLGESVQHTHVWADVPLSAIHEDPSAAFVTFIDGLYEALVLEHAAEGPYVLVAGHKQFGELMAQQSGVVVRCLVRDSAETIVRPVEGVIVKHAILASMEMCDELETDADLVQATGTNGSTPAPDASIRTASTASSAIGKWEDLQIWFLSDHSFQSVLNGKIKEPLNYAEFGMDDGRSRSGKPIAAWETLRSLAESGGIISSTSTAAEWPRLEKRVQEIRRAFKKHFCMDEDPLPYTQNAYRSRFKIGVRSSYGAACD